VIIYLYNDERGCSSVNAADKPLQKKISRLIDRYAELSSGDRATLSKAQLDGISSVAPYYKIAPISSENGVRIYKHKDMWSRVIYLLRFFPRHDASAKIGRLLFEGGVSKGRVEFLARCDYPENMRYMAEAAGILAGRGYEAVDWTTFGPLVYFWNKRCIRDIVTSYYAAMYPALRCGEGDED